MQIKVVKASTMKEAMEMVKQELGDDAVILHTKKYKEGGMFGLNSQEVVEVTAAIEDEPDNLGERARRVVPETPPVLPVRTPQPKSVLGQYKTNGTAEGVRLVDSPIPPPPTDVFGTGAMPAQPDAAPVRSEVPPMPVEPQRPEPEPVLPQEMPPAPAAVPPAAPMQPPVTPRPAEREEAEKREAERKEEQRREKEASAAEEKEKIQKLESELAQMKTLLAEVMSKDQPKDKITLREKLRRQDVEPDVLEDMAAKMAAGDTMLDYQDEKAHDSLRDYIAQAVNFSDGIALNKHGTRIVALIGTTGVGKTTTLAKIAARFVLERGVKAALITADTYRISAVEQLKTYSDILGLPIEIVYAPDELRVAIHKHRSKDLILIDTAGRSQKNEFQMKELQELLSVNKNIEIHLVLSATTKSRDAEEILQRFSVCHPSRVIFTKTDETTSVGMLLNLMRDKDLSLSFLTTGQSVPDDIVPASSEAVTSMLLRE